MEEKELTLKELLTNIGNYIKVVFRHKWWIALVAVIFGIYGYWNASKKKLKYTAELSFMIAEDESGNGGGVSAILGQFGLGGKGSSYNYGKIVELSKSIKIMEKVLFDTTFIGNKKNTIGNHFIKAYDIQIDDSITYFKNNRISRLDSVERVLFKTIYNKLVGHANSKEFILITDYDSDDKILRTKAETLNADLSIHLVTSLYKHLSEFYNVISIGKQAENFVKLQTRVDSLQSAIQSAEYSAAIQRDKLGLIRQLERVPASQQQRKAEILYTMYGESLKSLETARFLKQQNGDFFLTIDIPFKPLQNDKESLLVAILISMTLGGVIASIFFVIKNFLNNL